MKASINSDPNASEAKIQSKYAHKFGEGQRLSSQLMLLRIQVTEGPLGIARRSTMSMVSFDLRCSGSDSGFLGITIDILKRAIYVEISQSLKALLPSVALTFCARSLHFSVLQYLVTISSKSCEIHVSLMLCLATP